MICRKPILLQASSGVGRLVSGHLDIPVAGIGARLSCDAQVLVWYDMAGFIPPNINGNTSGALKRVSPVVTKPLD